MLREFNTTSPKETIHVITHPGVYLIGQPVCVEPPPHPVNWQGDSTNGERLAEFSGRVCYMSQDNPANRTTKEYIENIMKVKHGSVVEHVNYTLFIEGISRACTHELVRHRAGFSYSQLSQRYVDSSDVGFVIPPALLEHPELITPWKNLVGSSLSVYRTLSDELYEVYKDIPNRRDRIKKAREAARSVLPNCTETKIVVTANVRAWRHFLEMRCSPHADREIRRMALDCLKLLKEAGPYFFDDFSISEHTDGSLIAIPKYSKI